MAQYGNENWKPIHIRDNFLFLRGSVKGFETQGSEEGVNAIAGPNSNPGSWPYGPAVLAIAAGYGAASQPTNIRAVDVEQLFNFAGSTSIVSAGSNVAVRGCISISALTTFASGFLYGVQGKLVVQGTISSANYAAAVQAQLDLSAAVGVTGGPVQALWVDMGSSASAAVISAPTKLNIATLTNTTNAIIHACIQVVANASYLFDVTDLSYGGSNFYVHSGSGLGSIGTDYLVVLVNGVPKHIPLYA